MNKFCARAPVRVDCAGGGTDCPPYSVEHGGAVVNFALARYAYATVEKFYSDRDEVTIFSEDFGEEVSAARLAELPAGRLDFLAAFAKRLAPDFGFRMVVKSEAPPGSGLGSSGAVGVACVAALDAAMGVTRPAVETALLANDIERSDLGHAGGDQDSFGPALGGFNLLNYQVGGGTRARALELGSETPREIERRGLLVYTGQPHLSGNIHADIKASYALPDSPTVAAMHGLRAAGERCAEALESGDLVAFADCLNDNWQHHKQLHESCDNDRLRRFYAAAEGLVDGGKTCGAGGGGCLFFLCKDGRRGELERAFEELGGRVFPVRVDQEGVVVWQS